MITKPQVSSLHNLSNTVFYELLGNLLKPAYKKNWLQKIANLLKQYVTAKHVILHSFIDNQEVFATDDLSLLEKQQKSAIKIENPDLEPYWLDSIYIFPLSVEGKLEIVWGKKPQDEDLENYNYVFKLLALSLSNRADEISTNNKAHYKKSLLNFQNLLSNSDTLKNQITCVCKEVAVLLGVSRCQAKVFLQDSDLLFNSSLSVEYVDKGFLEAISVMPFCEQEWLSKLKNGNERTSILNERQLVDVPALATDIDSLLSIQSILGLPLVFQGKVIGVIALHQCDYRRNWKNEEISFLEEVALFLSVLIGKELETDQKYNSAITDITTGLINPDEFLRELNHIQIETNLSDLFFSLIMIDVEKLRDINLEFGFVGGNLVLSQTSRYLKRFYEKCGNDFKIARYSNDEFVVILKKVDENKAKLEAEKLKKYLSNITVLGIGSVDYNFSFVTYPTHGNSIAQLLTLLEQAMILSKSRGKSQISSFEEMRNKGEGKWQELVSNAIPEIILKKASLKTGPEILNNISEYLEKQKNGYSADILDSVQCLALALDAKDSYTEGHSKRVGEYAILLARTLRLDLQEIERIRLAAIMHDIGKIGIPENILCKPGKLTQEEYDIMKKHSVIGARILKPIRPLEKVVNLVLHHHEHWDGSGYPDGLRKENIPVGARIVSIVDAYQAMTSDRPYRLSLPFEETLKRLRDGKGKQWDPDLVEMFIKIVS